MKTKYLWEQRKIERYVNERNEKGNDELPILSVSIHSGVSGDQQTGTEAKRNVRRSEDKTKYKKVYPGDIVFNMMRAWQGAIGTSKALGMVSPAYIVARLTNEIDPIFLDYEFQLPMIIESINRRSYGVTDFRKRLYWDSFVKIQISIPNSKEEQLKIGSFFTELDRAITLHQRYRAPPSSFCVKLSVYVLYPQTRQLVRVLVYESIFTVISDRLIS